MRRVSPRLCGALLLILGVLIGTIADRLPQRVPLRAGDYWVLSGDFHVHAFPGDGSLSPWLLRDEAARAGLDVIAITNHNQVWTARLARWISNRSNGPIMIAGQEITNPTYHMIAVGLERTVDAEQAATEAAADVRAQRGLAIAAHPSARFHGYDAKEAVAALDGTEAAHSAVHEGSEFRAELRAFYERARGVKATVTPIGSSDFHATPPKLGLCRTYLFVTERSEAGVLEAIRSGRTLAVDGDGRLTGDAGLIALLGGNRPGGRSDEHRAWRRVSVVLAWIGTFAIVVFRR